MRIGTPSATLRLLCLLIAAAIVTPSAEAGRDENVTKLQERLIRSAQVIRASLGAPDKGIPTSLLAKAECVVVVPSMIKAGFIFGGRYGKGAATCRRRQAPGGWGPPSMISMSGGSFGLQIGGATVDVVMLVMNRSGMEELLKDNFKIGGDASAVAGPVGRSGTAETDVLLKAKILTYSRAQGLFAGLELKGAVFKRDVDANLTLYGESLTPERILWHRDTKVPADAEVFLDSLLRASPHDVVRAGEGEVSHNHVPTSR